MVYAGIDGVMAPTVTQAEKDQRRQKQITRRQQRGKAGVGNTRPLPQRRAGSDERFKVMKIGIVYDQAKQRRHAFVSEEDGKAFGQLLGDHAAQIHLEAADPKLSLTDGAKALLAAIDALGKQVRAPRKKDGVRRLGVYVWKRREMLDDPTALANGWDMGSGPTEATCKTLTLRLKRPGMTWDRDHAAGMMNRIALRESGQWKTYWAQRAAA